jgi:hypothetical protein
MDDRKKIVWLASYPKSGNTWFRAFLNALLYPAVSEVDINKLYLAPIASSRQLFDELTGVSSADLLPEEIDLLRPLVYRKNAVESDEILYQKVHDAFVLLPNGDPLFPADITKAVIYFIRNPLDVAVSFANHLNTTIDNAISIMNNKEYAFCSPNGKLHNQLRQILMTWSDHVESWVDESRMPLIIMRYEDMVISPLENFTRAVEFIGLNFTAGEIETALEKSSFDKLKKQEEEKGFNEKDAKAACFFRKGEAGDWVNVLSTIQVNRIVEVHGKTMKRFNYCT